MKRVINFIVCCLLIFNTTVFADNLGYSDEEIVGTAVLTDDTVFVDFQPTTAFKMNDTNYILAEDLNRYGFDVIWNPEEWSLYITRNREKDIEMFPAEKINVKRSEANRTRNLYKTDITPFVGNKQVEAYNLGGETIIKLRDLAEYAYIYWNKDEILGRG